MINKNYFVIKKEKADKEFSKRKTKLGTKDKVRWRFEEDNKFNNTKNATGQLFWNSTNNSQEKFYCIYFDVSINPGIRTPTIENDLLQESGNYEVNLGFVEGWQLEILEPIDKGFTLKMNPIDISVKTDAKADFVKALIYLKNNGAPDRYLFLIINIFYRATN